MDLLHDVTIHHTRHYAATNLYEKTRDLELVQYLGGWQSQEQCKEYCHCAPLSHKDIYGMLYGSENEYQMAVNQ